jgi:hypothetical protein
VVSTAEASCQAGGVHNSIVVLLVAVFLASAVEMVEALTIVVAVGVTRGWRSAIEGTIAAVVVLAPLSSTTSLSPPCAWSLVVSCWSSDCSGCRRPFCARPG